MPVGSESPTARLEYALQLVLRRCREANPNHMSIPPDGATVMQWLAEGIEDAKKVFGS